MTRRQFLRKASRAVGIALVVAPQAHRIVESVSWKSRWWGFWNAIDEFFWH